MKKSIKRRFLLGALPELGQTDWWTEKDWEEHNAYVEQLKKEGKYLTESEEYTFHFDTDDFKPFMSDIQPEGMLSNFGIMIPGGLEIRKINE